MKTLVLQSTFAAMILMATQGWSSGQSSSEHMPLPSGPLLASPESAQWQVTISQEKADAADHSFNCIKVKSVVVQGRVRHEEDKDAGGSSLSIWCLGEDEFYKTSSSSHFFLCSPNDQDFYIAKSRQRFLELTWISREKFIGRKIVNGKPCLVFGEASAPLSDRKISDLLASETAIDSHFKKVELSRVAYIDEDTRLPIYFQDGAATHIYQFLAAPDAPLAVPGEIVAMLKMRQEQTKRLNVEPSRS